MIISRQNVDIETKAIIKCKSVLVWVKEGNLRKIVYFGNRHNLDGLKP